MNNERNCRIADAMNTYNPALRIIKNKGYKIFFVPDAQEREDFPGDFLAIKDKRDFIASDPLKLLGLITIWENNGDEWYKNASKEREGLYDQILERACPNSEADYTALGSQKYKILVEDYQILFEAFNIEISNQIPPETLFHIASHYYREDK